MKSCSKFSHSPAAQEKYEKSHLLTLWRGPLPRCHIAAAARSAGPWWPQRSLADRVALAAADRGELAARARARSSRGRSRSDTDRSGLSDSRGRVETIRPWSTRRHRRLTTA